jgi:hypothetical protein
MFVAELERSANPIMLSLKPSFKYPVPDWDVEYNNSPVGEVARDESNTYWCNRGRVWSNLLCSAFGTGYVTLESDNFFLICGKDRSTASRLARFAEGVNARLNIILGDLVQNGFGKIPILITNDLETYYDYVAQYLPDGDHAFSGGMYINQGYGHFVFCYHDLTSAEAVIAHEMTHALLLGLQMPLWLNEGIAQLAEVTITGRSVTDLEAIKETIGSFWTATTIHEFWSGTSFNRQDEGQMQSYHLAMVLTRKLIGDMTLFRKFVHESIADDAGESSMRKYYGSGLGDLVEDYLGEGDWTPKKPNHCV